MEHFVAGAQHRPDKVLGDEPALDRMGEEHLDPDRHVVLAVRVASRIGTDFEWDQARWTERPIEPVFNF